LALPVPQLEVLIGVPATFSLLPKFDDGTFGEFANLRVGKPCNV
jgi:hypothetical protein